MRDVDEQILKKETFECSQGTSGTDALSRLRRQRADGNHNTSLVAVGMYVRGEAFDFLDSHCVFLHKLYPDRSAFGLGMRIRGCWRRGVFLDHEFGRPRGKGQLGATANGKSISTFQLLVTYFDPSR